MVAPSMHPDSAECYAFDVTQPQAHPHIEHLAEPEVGAEPQGNVRIGITGSRGDINGRLGVWNDAHLGVLGIDTASQREAAGDDTERGSDWKSTRLNSSHIPLSRMP